jgi:hypothetical protein
MSDVLGLQGMGQGGVEPPGGCVSLISYVGHLAEAVAATQASNAEAAASGWCISLISYVAAEGQQAQPTTQSS